MGEWTLKGMLEKGFERRVASTVDRLRRLADELEAEAKRITSVPTPGTASATAVAANLVHSMMWGIANASLDGIVSAAEEYDRELAKERSASTDLGEPT